MLLYIYSTHKIIRQLYYIIASKLSHAWCEIFLANYFSHTRYSIDSVILCMYCKTLTGELCYIYYNWTVKLSYLWWK